MFVYASDAEYQDLDEASLQERRDFFRGADAVLFDAQYGLRESWESKANWGHSSAMIGVDLAREAGVKRLLLFHHEPTYSDVQLQEIQATAIAYQAQTEHGQPCEILLAQEGMELDLAPAGAIDLYVTEARDAAILTPGSVFDEQGAQQLLAKLNLVPDGENLGGSILDLTQVDTLTTSGLKALIALSREHAAGTLVLAGPSPAVEQVIRLAGYGDYFAIYPDVAAALKAVQARKTLDLPGQTLGGRYQIVGAHGRRAPGDVAQGVGPAPPGAGRAPRAACELRAGDRGTVHPADAPAAGTDRRADRPDLRRRSGPRQPADVHRGRAVGRSHAASSGWPPTPVRCPAKRRSRSRWIWRWRWNGRTGAASSTVT